MRHAATAFAGVLSLSAAYVLYTENVDTRRIEASAQAAERMRDRLDADIAVLRADRAYLARPQRIEAEARKLGLVPPTADSRTTLDALLADPILKTRSP